jgi:hypothetical protein
VTGARGAASGGGIIPEGVENGLAGRFAGDGLILQQRRVGLLLERRVEGSDGHHEARCFLGDVSCRLWCPASSTEHPGSSAGVLLP